MELFMLFAALGCPVIAGAFITLALRNHWRNEDAN